MMAEITDWVDIGQAMRVRTDAVVVTVAEQPNGRIAIAIEPRGESIVHQPDVKVAGAGTFLIDVDTEPRAQLVEAL
jgi:hypothetical protein